MKCGITEFLVRCQNEATHKHGNLDVCEGHFRNFNGNRFGQKYSPPWTKEQALDVLIQKDGFKEDIARKLVDEYFGS